MASVEVNRQPEGVRSLPPCESRGLVHGTLLTGLPLWIEEEASLRIL